MAVNFGEYEIIQEMSRGPLGLTARVRGPDGGRYFLSARFPDPIAAPGEERLVVDVFLEQARVQQLASRGEHWASVHSVGERDDCAFVVMDFFPRDAQTLIGGRSRLHLSTLRQVALGVVDGLIELRELAGRAHGALRPDRVLIDDEAGPGRWRVCLTEPSPEAWDAAELAAASERDARAVASLLIGLVEHRGARASVGSVDESDAWVRVGGARAGQLVAIVNRLLSPDAAWLERAREDFERLRVRAPSTSRSRLVVVGAAGLMLAVGGGYAGWSLLEPPPAPVVVGELSDEAWKQWLSDAAVVSQVDRWLSEHVDEASGSAGAGLAAAIAELKSSQPWPRGRPAWRGWRPSNYLDQVPRDDVIIGSSEAQKNTYRVQAEKRGGSIAAQRTHDTVDQLIVRCDYAVSKARQDLEALAASLAALDVKGPASGVIARAAPGETSSAVDLKHVVAALAFSKLGDDAREVAAELDALRERCDKLAEVLPDDPVIADVRGNVGAYLDEQLAAVQSARETVWRAREAGEAAGRQVADAERILAHPRRLYVPELEELVANELDPEAVGLERIRSWCAFATDPRVQMLNAWNDPLWVYRGFAFEALPLFATGRQDIAKLEALQHRQPDEEIAAALGRYGADLEAVRARLKEALQIPRTRSNLALLQERKEKIEKGLMLVQESASELLNRKSVKISDVIAMIEGSGERYPSDPVLEQAYEAAQRAQLSRAQAALAMSEDEQSAVALRVRDDWSRQRERLRAIFAWTDVDFPRVATDPSLVDTTSLRSAFERRRQEMQRVLVADALAKVSGGASPELEHTAAMMARGLGRLGAIAEELERWPALDEVESALRLTFAESGGVESAWEDAAAPLQDLLDRARGLPDEPTELMRIAADGTEVSIVRRAAFERLESLVDAEGSWPATGRDVRAIGRAMRDVQSALETSREPEWSADDVARIGRSLWAAGAERAASEEAFESVWEVRDAFDPARDARLSLRVRRNGALLELKGAIARVHSAGDGTEADQQAEAIVTAWLGQTRDLWDEKDSVWIQRLRDASRAGESRAAAFDADEYGPGRRGWSGSANEGRTVLSYVKGGRRWTFRQVSPGPDDSEVWFLSSEEVSLGLLLSEVDSPQARAEFEEIRSASEKGPRGWRLGPDGPESAGSWFEYKEATKPAEFIANPLFMSGIQDPTGLNEAPDVDLSSMPAQNISLKLMNLFCAGTGTVLPPAEVWRAAAEEMFGAGGVAVDASAVSRFGLQVRDEVWEDQAAYTDSLPARFTNWWWWYGGVFNWDQDEQVRDLKVPIPNYRGASFGVDDGHLYFAPCNADNARGPWHHLVGNVGEVVSLAGEGFGVIGGSAMSPSDVSLIDPVPFERFDLPCSDVGFRPAFEVLREDLHPGVAGRVADALEQVPMELVPSS